MCTCTSFLDTAENKLSISNTVFEWGPRFYQLEAKDKNFTSKFNWLCHDKWHRGCLLVIFCHKEEEMKVWGAHRCDTGVYPKNLALARFPNHDSAWEPVFFSINHQNTIRTSVINFYFMWNTQGRPCIKSDKHSELHFAKLWKANKSAVFAFRAFIWMARHRPECQANWKLDFKIDSGIDTRNLKSLYLFHKSKRGVWINFLN